MLPLSPTLAPSHQESQNPNPDPKLNRIPTLILALASSTSHWDEYGDKPYHRLFRAGFREHVMENIWGQDVDVRHFPYIRLYARAGDGDGDGAEGESGVSSHAEHLGQGTSPILVYARD